ncbi:MAG: sulfite exporter TauE/SafE family protein, partial [Marinovum sp.]|nr:sulfite exporter TauE/SafE family protein [Marinovum sp.]
MTSLLSLSENQVWVVALVCLLAGIVRGFSGFALSALVMASAALIIPPVELIPVCWWLEICA